MLQELAEKYDYYNRYMPRHCFQQEGGPDWGIYTEIYPDHYASTNFDIENMIQANWQKMYEKAIRQISGIVMGKDDYYIVRFTPGIIQSSNYEPCIRLELNYSIMIAPQKEMVIPIWTYEPHTGKALEWRCGYCNTPNKKEERLCTQCGAPRALLIQEIEGG